MTLNQLIYRVTRPLGGLKVARFLSRNHPKILMYHRITKDPKGEGLPVEQFKRQMEIIRKHFNPLTLKELMKAHEEGRVPKHAVCVTFDDGYADFSDLALPLLKENGVPATLFVTTGFVNGDLWLWPDQIKYIIEKRSKEKINTSIFFGDSDVETDISNHELWKLIANKCIEVSNSDKISLINALAKDLDVSLPKEPPKEYRPLTWEYLRNMDHDGISIGSHSYSHPIMTKLSGEDLRYELEASRDMIISNLGKKPVAFCYPNGQKPDVDDRVKRAVKSAGYEYAVAAYPSRYAIDDKWEVKRYSANRLPDFFEKTVYGYTYLGMKK